MDEKITNENKSQKFNVKIAWSSTTTLNEFQKKNFQNRREYEKMINTGKLRVYSSFPSVYHPLNSREWDGELWSVDEDLRAKKSREKQSEVQVHAPRSSGSSRGAFSKNQFRDKGRMNDLAIFAITWKWLGIIQNHKHEKFRNFRSFSAVYYFPIPIRFVEIMAKKRF